MFFPSASLDLNLDDNVLCSDDGDGKQQVGVPVIGALIKPAISREVGEGHSSS